MIYTTAKDFELFQKECLKWIDKLDLNEWEFQFKHSDLDYPACITANYKAKMVSVEFSKTRREFYPTRTRAIKIDAQHEILHALLENLYNYAISRTLDSNVYLAEEHVVIHRLQKAFER